MRHGAWENEVLVEWIAKIRFIVFFAAQMSIMMKVQVEVQSVPSDVAPVSAERVTEHRNPPSHWTERPSGTPPQVAFGGRSTGDGIPEVVNQHNDHDTTISECDGPNPPPGNTGPDLSIFGRSPVSVLSLLSPVDGPVETKAGHLPS